MVEYTPNTRPGDQGRAHHTIHETTSVRQGNSNGVTIAIVLLILAALAGFFFWPSDGNEAVNTTAPAAGVNEQVAPGAAGDPVLSVPAPDAPAMAPDASTPVTPAPAIPDAAPMETAPAPANDG